MGKWREAMEVDQRVKPWTRMLAVGLVERARSGTSLEVRFANGLHAGSEKRELTQGRCLGLWLDPLGTIG